MDGKMVQSKRKKGQVGSSVHTHILLLDGALFTVVGIRDSGTSTDHTPALVRPIVTLVTYANQGAGSHVGITNHTLAIACKERRLELYAQAISSYTELSSVLRGK